MKMGFCRAPTAATFFNYLLFLCILGCCSCVLSKAQQVPAMYVFGDSLVDVGNNNYLQLSLAKADFPHNGVDYPGGKATGRFSNGKNFADFLAEKVGLPTSPPYLSNKNGGFLQGVSFASGGAGIFNGTDEFLKQSIPLTKQVEYFSMVHSRLVQRLGSSRAAAQESLSRSIFLTVIGSNDMFDYFKSNSNPSKLYTPQQYVDLMLSSLNSHLTRLRNLGARKFVVTGLGAVGCCPTLRLNNDRSPECNEEVNFWSTKYNDGLRSMLQEFQSNAKDISYTYFDTYKVFTSFIQTPATYGFTEVKSACCGLGKLKAQVPCIPISSYCSNRSDHMFWDQYHPTQAAVQIFADFIFNGSQQYATPINMKQLIAL